VESGSGLVLEQIALGEGVVTGCSTYGWLVVTPCHTSLLTNTPMLQIVEFLGVAGLQIGGMLACLEALECSWCLLVWFLLSFIWVYLFIE